jgi:hypothetical protein
MLPRRLTKAEKAAAEKAAMAETFNAMNVLSSVFPPATDFISFHIEHDGKRIDPVTIEGSAVKKLSGARRTRKSTLDASIHVEQSPCARFGRMAVRTEERHARRRPRRRPVTTAEIEAVAEPLRCVVRDLIGPSSAHGDLPFRSSGLL